MPTQRARQRDTGDTPTGGTVIATRGIFRARAIANLTPHRDERSRITHQWNQAAEQSHPKNISRRRKHG